MRVPIVNRNSPGQISDTPPTLLPPEAWTSVENARFKNGIAERPYGQTASGITVSPTPYQIFPFKDYNDNPRLFLAGSNKVFITDGTTTTDITGASTPGASPNSWSYTNFNGIPVLNESSIKPQALTTIPGGPLIDLTAWPATYVANVMRSFKNFLVALAVTKGGTAYPNLVLWSDVADPGSLPASWDVTDPSTLAGENPLANNDDDDDVEIIDGGQLKDFFMVYKRLTATVMSLGGPNVFAFNKVFDKGVMNRNCIARPAINEARHVCFGLDDIYMHNGYTEDSILEDKLRKWLFDRIDPTLAFMCHVAHNRYTGEVWFMYPETGASYISHALVWNYKRNNFSIIELPNTYYMSVGPFVVPVAGADTWDGDAVTTWDGALDSWDAAAATALRPRFLQAEASAWYLFDTSTPWRTATFERQGLAIAGRDQAGQPVYDSDSVKVVRGMWPRFEGTGMLNFYLGASDSPAGTITWTGPYPFNVASVKKVDCFNKGRILHTRFVSTDDGVWRFLGYDLEIETAGEI